jgi:hypothetical protein
MKDQTLQDVNDCLIDAGRFMKDVAEDPNKVECLETFSRCQDIVKWLKEVTKGYITLVNYFSVCDQEYAWFECRCS